MFNTAFQSCEGDAEFYQLIAHSFLLTPSAALISEFLPGIYIKNMEMKTDYQAGIDIRKSLKYQHGGFG
jgi:hypothetical protein